MVKCVLRARAFRAAKKLTLELEWVYNHLGAVNDAGCERVKDFV